MYEFDYKFNGKDWGLIKAPEGHVNYCGDGLNQSPINLMTPLGTYGYAYGTPQSTVDDAFDVQFADIYGNNGVTIGWNSGFYVELPPKESKINFFTSELAVTKIGANTTEFDGIAFNLHTPSEHAIDGRLYDLEMQVMYNAT